MLAIEIIRRGLRCRFHTDKALLQILLLVYIIYLLFQLKSHAYMYESTPQHILDAESTPGPAAAWLDTSSSSDDSSSSSDSDSSGHSRDTIGHKMKKVLRARRRRKSSLTSVDTTEVNAARNVHAGRASGNPSPNDDVISEASSSRKQYFPGTTSNDHGDSTDEEKGGRRSKQRKRRHARRKHKTRDYGKDSTQPQQNSTERPENDAPPSGSSEPRRVDFALPANERFNGPCSGEGAHESAGKANRPFTTLRSLSVKNLAPSVFTQKPNTLTPAASAPIGPVPRVRYGIRRTNSLPDRLGQQQQLRPPGAMLPAQVPLMSLNTAAATTRLGDEDEEEHLTRWAAVALLLLTTGLVAVCAEFLVSSIQEVTDSSSIGEIFIGLIILPIVGNAAEHVTAVTVAMKNKMDLAIGVAVGSSIQIALFVTPLVVILGWIMDKEMTLYFTLFETVCLFVSAFIVNFLVLDGRSNYLEGALLCAVYIIIAVVAFFYPSADDASSWGS